MTARSEREEHGKSEREGHGRRERRAREARGEGTRIEREGHRKREERAWKAEGRAREARGKSTGRERKAQTSIPKGGETRDTKTLNLSRNIVAFQVFGRCFLFFTLQDQLVAQQKHLLRVEESCCSK